MRKIVHLEIDKYEYNNYDIYNITRDIYIKLIIHIDNKYISLSTTVLDLLTFVISDFEEALTTGIFIPGR